MVSANTHRSGETGQSLHTAGTPGQGPVHKTERWLARRLLEMTGDAPISLVLWDGSEIKTTTQSPSGRLRIHDRGALRKLVSNPEFEFGELYSAGRIEVEGSLAEFLEGIYRVQTHPGARMTGLFPGLSRKPHNSRSRARENIHQHYDIGNDFFRLWLDAQLVYTCAYYPTGNETLEQAQVAKLDYVCRKLRLQPGERVAEAGCGWGALAMHMARHYGVTVRACNISPQQVVYAQARARREGLEDRVEFVEDDYRNLQGEYDAFVSIGMLEHVGVSNYPALGAVMDRVLRRDGRGLIHTIGRDQPRLMNAWIEQRIFPGSQPPSISEMMTLFEPWGFSVLDIENLRLHYVRTLQDWWGRYEQALDRVREMFDETFVRMWRLYLACSIAAFNSGSLQLFQVVFTRSGNNAVPWTREHLYRGAS